MAQFRVHNNRLRSWDARTFVRFIHMLVLRTLHRCNPIWLDAVSACIEQAQIS